MDNKGMSSKTVIIAVAVLVIVIVVVIGYIYFQPVNSPDVVVSSNEKIEVDGEIDIEDLTDDHLDDAISELDEIDFDLYGIR